MYRYFIVIACLPLSLCASHPNQNRKILDRHNIEAVANNSTKNVSDIHILIMSSSTEFNAEINSQEYKDLNPFLFFASLPQDLRIKTLTNNFFSDDTSAAKEFERKPYAWALYLLGEYQQKPHPTMHLSSKYIFLLHPNVVATVAEIEKQRKYPSFTQPLDPFPFSSQIQNVYAKITYEQLQTLKTIPNSAIKSTNLNEKIIAYTDSYKEPLKPIKDTFAYCLTDSDFHRIICGLTLIKRMVFYLEKIISCCWNGNLHWSLPAALGLDTIILYPFINNKVQPIFGDIGKSWVTIRTVIDTLSIGLTTYSGQQSVATILYASSIFPSLCLATTFTHPFIFGICFGIRCGTPYPNRFTLNSKKTKTGYCPLL